MTKQSPAEINEYRDRGFVVPKFRLPKERVTQLRTALERVIAANPQTRPEQLVSVHIDETGAEGVVGDGAFLDIARHDRIVDLVEQVIGPNVVLWGCQAFCKPPGDGMEVPWHQDDVELEAGQMSLHDAYLIHGSNPNRSTRRRAGLAIRYMPGSSLFDRGQAVAGTSAGYTVDFSNRPLWLLRGTDTSGKNDFQIGHRRD